MSKKKKVFLGIIGTIFVMWLGGVIIDSANESIQSEGLTDVPLQELFPTYNDGLTWHPEDEKDYSFQNDDMTIQGYDKSYVKGFSMMGVTITKFNSKDEAKQRTDETIARVQEDAEGGFDKLGGFGFPNECYGQKENLGFVEERMGIICTVNNYSVFISGVGGYDLDDEGIKFAKIIINKIR